MTGPSDIVSFAPDNRRPESGLPRRMRARARGAAPSQPALWAAAETRVGEGVWGQYPKGFVTWAAELLRCAPDQILHLCSGSLAAGQGRARVDLRPEAAPDVVADARRLPFADDTFAGVMIDPPYSVEYAKGLYGIEYPRPKHLLSEAARVVRPCGRIGMLHFLVPSPPPRCRIETIRGVTTGCGFRIRAFTVFEREQDGLPMVTATERSYR